MRLPTCSFFCMITQQEMLVAFMYEFRFVNLNQYMNGTTTFQIQCGSSNGKPPDRSNILLLSINPKISISQVSKGKDIQSLVIFESRHGPGTI